jgi:hypothetical protein
LDLALPPADAAIAIIDNQEQPVVRRSTDRLADQR